ncbi:MAG TPA: PBP1A family penicillin-binding protein [Gemmatimonadales bacterium]|nr:PBP1A family penicillin-binding protein [Gemmatimonadales bacterium]
MNAREMLARIRAPFERMGTKLQPVADRVAASRQAQWIRAHWLASAVIVVLFGTTVTAGYAFSCGFRGCPSTASIQSFRPREGSKVLDRSGKLLGRLEYVRRVNVSLDSTPKLLREAFIAVEDRRFYQHHGVDWRGVFRAAFRNARDLGVSEGFSTITMQVVRNAFLSDIAQERTLRRKLIEVVLARRLEHSLSKDQILQLYLNVIYLGNGVYGVEAASRDFFGKHVDQLTLPEMATLAALPKGPSAYDPRRHPDRARARRNLVLSLMAEEGYITDSAASKAAAIPLTVEKKGWYPRAAEVDALDPVRAMVDSLLGDSADAYGDIVVRTTLDARAQAAAEQAVRRHAVEIERQAEANAGKTDDDVEGAMVALDPANGGILALVNGNHYERGGFMRALNAHRQPGSAFKPFVYGAALAEGFTPATVLDDSPVELELASGETWEPGNYGGEYSGRLAMRRALMLSANAAAVRMADMAGRPNVITFAHHLGITSPLPDVPSLALGPAEVTPLELVRGYAPFANGGFRVTPRLVTSITQRDGTIIWREDSTARQLTRVMDPREAFQLTSMLRAVVDHGTGFEVRREGIRGPIAGKTGTTNEGRDVWFVGYTPTMVAGFWFGYDTPRSLGYGATGGHMAAPAFADFYRDGWRGRDTTDWAVPSGMVSRVIDSYNGELANEYCPVTNQEWFKAGTEPTSVCQEHSGSFWDALGEMGGAIGKAFKKILGF